jgi:NADP-dependent 3-hydroxy acid dehydrogenase YdfG
MPALTGQIAVITGASSGIGKAIALSLADEGAKICLLGRNLEKLEAAARCAKQFSEYISIYKTDLGIDEDIRLLAAKLQEKFGAIDILIHSAGVISVGRIEEASIEEFDRQYRINIRAPYFLTQALLPMLKLRCGQVVFVNSSAGLTARAGVGQYAATKHALRAIADGFREEVNADGLRVLSLFLGRTATPMQEVVHKMEGKTYHPEHLMQPEDVAAVVINALSLPRTAEVTDIYVRPLHKP